MGYPGAWSFHVAILLVRQQAMEPPDAFMGSLSVFPYDRCCSKKGGIIQCLLCTVSSFRRIRRNS